ASDLDISSIDSFPFEGLYAPDDVHDDDVPTSSATPASTIGPEFWNRIFDQGNPEQLRRIAAKPVAQNVTLAELDMMSEITQPPKKRDDDTTDKKKEDSDNKEEKEKKSKFLLIIVTAICLECTMPR
ncbi:unnamed protein product, partial [Dicrocoelium dendriticum]